ncbi:MAG: hypothetical protein ACREFE_09560 [Limisphaerales bacterium]
MKKLHFVLGILLMASAFSANAGLTNAVYWDFFATASPASNSFTGLTVADLSRGNAGASTFLNSSSASSGYTTAAGFPASGGTNAEASASAGALDLSSSTFFATALTLDLSSLDSLMITNVSFGSRSSTTGPALLSLYASTDDFGLDFEAIGSVAVSTNSTWSAVQFANLSLDINPGETLSLRLYGSNGTSTAANWRMDDLGVALTPAPEPSIISLSFASGLICWISLRRKFKEKIPRAF